MAKPSADKPDLKKLGVNLQEVVDSIRPNLEGTYKQIGRQAHMSENNVNRVLNGLREPSLWALAALAHAAGGRLVVRFEPVKRGSAKKPE